MDILLAMLVYFGLSTSPDMTTVDMQKALMSDPTAATYYQMLQTDPTYDPSIMIRTIDRTED
ncbi:MAG: hypothetical protein JSS89_10985 [Bacteroidetes bacterium]|nr:hypothetical protein [Bacteroidota bacterium]